MNTISFNTTMQNGVIHVPKRFMKKSGAVRVTYTTPEENHYDAEERIPNETTLRAISEVRDMAKNPSTKGLSAAEFSQFLKSIK
jgi:hypothetical protein